MRVVSHPDPDYPQRRHDHLWLLVGGGDYDDRAMAYYIGPDRDEDGDDLASGTLATVVEKNMLSRPQAEQALADYRGSFTG